MTIHGQDDFEQVFLALTRPQNKFAPRATYIPEGDCIEFIARPDDYYAERCDGLVTVYRSIQTNEIVGSVVKSVTPLCQRLTLDQPELAIIIKGKKLKLSWLFRKLCTGTEDRLVVKAYHDLIRVAEEADVETELFCSAS